MTTIVTEHGPVVGTNAELVAAAVAIVAEVPAPRGAKLDELVTAVRLPWQRVNVAVSW